MYEQDVLSLIHELSSDTDKEVVALLTGGSMMYIDTVCNGIDDIPTVDDKTREWMKQRLATEGLSALVEELKRLDPEHWALVDRNNPRRVVHALEICHMTGKTYTSFRKNEKKQRPFDIIKIGVNRPREELYERINHRVEEMIANGMVEEARKMYPMRELNALNTVGYKELFEHFDGTTTLEEAIYKIQSNTRRYARKQLTWFKRDETIQWFSLDKDAIESIIDYCRENILA
jgi:tRNA dimethylallyltransferase